LRSKPPVCGETESICSIFGDSPLAGAIWLACGAAPSAPGNALTHQAAHPMIPQKTTAATLTNPHGYRGDYRYPTASLTPSSPAHQHYPSRTLTASVTLRPTLPKVHLRQLLKPYIHAPHQHRTPPTQTPRTNHILISESTLGPAGANDEFSNL